MGRVDQADRPAFERASTTQTNLFLDVSALTLLGGSFALLVASASWNAETLIALGLGAALVIVARTA
jgi:hypothetical protein